MTPVTIIVIIVVILLVIGAAVFFVMQNKGKAIGHTTAGNKTTSDIHANEDLKNDLQDALPETARVSEDTLHSLLSKLDESGMSQKEISDALNYVPTPDNIDHDMINNYVQISKAAADTSKNLDWTTKQGDLLSEKVESGEQANAINRRKGRQSIFRGIARAPKSGNTIDLDGNCVINRADAENYTPMEIDKFIGLFTSSDEQELRDVLKDDYLDEMYLTVVKPCEVINGTPAPYEKVPIQTTVMPVYTTGVPVYTTGVPVYTTGVPGFTNAPIYVTTSTPRPIEINPGLPPTTTMGPYVESTIPVQKPEITEPPSTTFIEVPVSQSPLDPQEVIRRIIEDKFAPWLVVTLLEKVQAKIESMFSSLKGNKAVGAILAGAGVTIQLKVVPMVVNLLLSKFGNKLSELFGSSGARLCDINAQGQDDCTRLYEMVESDVSVDNIVIGILGGYATEDLPAFLKSNVTDKLIDLLFSGLGSVAGLIPGMGDYFKKGSTLDTMAKEVVDKQVKNVCTTIFNKIVDWYRTNLPELKRFLGLLFSDPVQFFKVEVPTLFKNILTSLKNTLVDFVIKSSLVSKLLVTYKLLGYASKEEFKQDIVDTINKAYYKIYPEAKSDATPGTTESFTLWEPYNSDDMDEYLSQFDSYKRLKAASIKYQQLQHGQHPNHVKEHFEYKTANYRTLDAYNGSNRSNSGIATYRYAQ